jgi:hypothetical protein
MFVGIKRLDGSNLVRVARTVACITGILTLVVLVTGASGPTSMTRCPRP